MNLIRLLSCTLVFCGFQTLAADTRTDELPPILNFYPACDFELVKKASVSNYSTSPASKDNKAALINKIRMKAARAEATGVIITNIAIVTGERHNFRPGKQKSVLKAELIKTCSDHDKPTDKLANFNSEGVRQIGLTVGYSQIRHMKFKAPEKPTFHRPSQVNTTVSLSSGVYGIELGASYEQVKRELGDPSIELNVYQEQLVLGYGRRHWYYFQDDQLVRVHTSDSVLNQNALSQVPMWPFFDDDSWLIEGSVSKGDELSKVQEALETDAKLDAKNQLVIVKNGKQLRLKFTFEQDHYTYDKTYTLESFDYQTLDYQSPSFNKSLESKDEFTQLSAVYEKLKSNQTVKAPDLKMSPLLGAIWVEPTEQLHIYGDNLIMRVKDDDITEVLLVESLLQSELNTEQSWFIGDFKEGLTMSELRPYFGDGALELDLDVLIDANSYELRLAFDDSKGEPQLYEAKLKMFNF